MRILHPGSMSPNIPTPQRLQPAIPAIRPTPTPGGPEFSRSQYGRALIDAVAHDKFLRPLPGEPATHFTRAFEEVADLYYLDERVIGPALARDELVLKDRHYHTVLYTLTPTLVDADVFADENGALVWLRSLLTGITHCKHSRPLHEVVVGGGV